MYICRVDCEFSLYNRWFRTTIYCFPSQYPCIVVPLVLITNTVTFNCSSSLCADYSSPQIAAVHHAIKTDCGVGVANVGNARRDILVLVGYRASKNGINMSREMQV